MLHKAGMKVWVLTGDKQETAISMAFACKLITSSMQKINIDGLSFNGIRKFVHALAHTFATINCSCFMNYGLIIEGWALWLCLGDELIWDTLWVCLCEVWGGHLLSYFAQTKRFHVM
jgi:magnesium-transporting ATPase (P-type)